MGLDAAHHSLTPPVVPYALRDGRSRPVITIEGKSDVLVELGAMFGCSLADLVEDLNRCAAWVLVGLNHDGRHGTDQYGFGDQAFAILSHIARYFSPAGGMPDVNGVAESQFF